MDCDNNDFDADALDALRESERDEEREKLRVDEDKTRHIFTEKYASNTRGFNPVVTHTQTVFSSSPPAFSSPLSGPSAATQNLCVPSNWELKTLTKTVSTPSKLKLSKPVDLDSSDDDDDDKPEYKFPAWMNMDDKTIPQKPSTIQESQVSSAFDFNESDSEKDDEAEEDKENNATGESFTKLTSKNADASESNASAMRRRLEEAMEMEMFGSGVKPKTHTSPLDIPPHEENDEEDDGGLFSDSDVDENILKPWENQQTIVTDPSIIGVKRKMLMDKKSARGIVVFSSDDDEKVTESVAKRKFKPKISLSDSESDSNDGKGFGDDDDDVTQRPIAKIGETGFYGQVRVSDKEMGLEPQRQTNAPPIPRPRSPITEYDEDGEPIFHYPDSSDDDEREGDTNMNIDDNRDPNSPSHRSHPLHRQQQQPNRQQRRQRGEDDDPTKPRDFSRDQPRSKPLSPLPTGGRKKAPSKAEIEAKRYKELMIIAQQMKREIEARKVGVCDGVKGEEDGGDLFGRRGNDGDEYERTLTGGHFNFLLMPTDGRSWRTAVDSKGRRLYFPYKKKSEILALQGVRRGANGEFDGRGVGGGVRKMDLLGESIHVLLRKLEEEISKKADEEEARRLIFERMGSQEGREMLGEDQDEEMGNASATADAGDGKLWVDKYAPRMYIDLVGDERINREVLTWVKQWDHCVFKKPIKKSQTNQSEWQRPVDAYNRPEKKILLLSGPAGLGKTTLAHIVGRHSGYNVIEINASDDRTGESLRNKLIGAIESQSLNSRKPNLIIIDEIDGASATGGETSFMQLLVDLANGELKKGGAASKEKDGEPAEKNAKKDKSKTRVLLRPIICICNDQYAPVLRPLRMISQAYAFRPPAHRILANRLTEICKNEGLQTDLRTLMALCELTDGDIRSSLNTLQFFKRRTKVLTMEMLAGLDVGHKDMTRGLFKVWEDIFMIPSAKKRKKLGMGEQGKDNDANRYIHRLLSLISASGEIDKIVQGCHENYLKMRIVDSISSSSDATRSSTKIEQALDWLVFHDRLDRFINVDKDFELFKYQPFTIVNFYRLFAGVAKPAIEFPRAEYDNFVAHRSNENIISAFINTLSLNERVTWGNRGRLLQELVTAVNVNLLKSNEKLVLDKLVNIMVSFGLKFIQEKGEDGHYLFRLFPPIEKLIIGKEDANAPSCSANYVSCEAVDFQRGLFHSTFLLFMFH
ncbi:hypothetical protein BDR26DRAFT_868938 [Obelidium mucronatum]|nr:hypothetical protein BDR26DRAFT_868938 [Obelidium mucronatum]